MKQKPTDFDDFFAGIQTTPQGKFERWAAEDPERTAKFWAMIDEADRRGVSMMAALRRWNQVESPLPVQYCHMRKRISERRETNRK